MLEWFVVLLDPVILLTAIVHFSKAVGEAATGATASPILWFHENADRTHARLTLSLRSQTTLSQESAQTLRIWEERGSLGQRVQRLNTSLKKKRGKCSAKH